METVILKIMGTAMLSILVSLGVVGFVGVSYSSSWIKASILVVLCISSITLLMSVLTLIWI